MKKLAASLTFLIALLSPSLHAQQCQLYFEGCGSCVADGIWGSLSHNEDCSISCDKVCGNERAELTVSGTEKSEDVPSFTSDKVLRDAYGKNISMDYRPFPQLWDMDMTKRQAKYIYRYDNILNPDTHRAEFTAMEFNRFKNKQVTKEIFSIKTEADKLKLKKILNIPLDTDSLMVPLFKFALSITPLPWAIQSAMAAVELVNSLPTGVVKARGNLAAYIGLEGKVFLTETISLVGMVWVYDSVISYQIKMGGENIQVVLGAIRLRTDIK